MGYQALLFCPDDKIARVVTQVFTELDFQVEPANEPFAAVKKLMAQRYDAVVVDCENEQNATLLFKSARNSSSNQSSLALALVEGQAGVAKAYRIGANLVLTKPINVEQAKGTLRVARGLLRKNADAAGANQSATTPAVPKPLPPPPVSSPLSTASDATAKTRSVFEPPEFSSPLPAMAGSALENMKPGALAVPELKKPSIEADAAPKVQASPLLSELPKTPAAAPSASNPFHQQSPIVSPHGSAAAPAPAKEMPTPKKAAESELFAAPASGLSSSRSSEPVAAPSFAALGDAEPAEASKGSKKIFAIAAVIVVAAAAGYFGWTKFGKSSTPSSPAMETHQPATPASATASPSPASAAINPAPASMPSATPAAAPASPKPSAVVGSSPSSKLSIASEAPNKANDTPEVVVKKIEPPPMHVKAQPAASTQAPAAQSAEENSAPIPNPLAMGSSNTRALSGLVSSSPVNLPKVAPSTLKISQGVSQGLLINKVQPRYPQNALSMRIQGPVVLEATINREGKISNLKVLSGDPVLSRAAVEAVRQWRYKPYFLDGEPVDIQTQITVNFKLPN